MSLAACEERCARLRTSDATTAKPRPASPARAASTAALSASRLVCRAISSITPMMSEILRDDSSIRAIAVDRIADDGSAAFGDGAGLRRIIFGLASVLGIALHRFGDFLHRSGGFLQARRLLFGALRQVGRAGGNLRRGAGHFVGGGLDVADGCPDPFDDRLGGGGDQANLVFLIDMRYRHGEIARRDFLKRLDQRAQRPRNRHRPQY